MLREQGYENLVEIDRDTTNEQMTQALIKADFVFHLAGVNRPKNEKEFKQGNADLTEFIVAQLAASGKKTPIVLSSSSQAVLDNPYGVSKASAEKVVEHYASSTGARHYIYRFPNVFGKWCRPNYNSFIATFCYNIANDLAIEIHDPSAKVTLVYIDDVCNELIGLLASQSESGLKTISTQYHTTVGEIADKLSAFKTSRDNLVIEKVGIGLTRALYSTYISYFKPEQFHYDLPRYGDERGVFCEMLKTKDSGQFSFFTAYPGITRGGHYHHTKNEKFLVIKGQALFKFENISTGERYELTTNGNSPRVVETVPGWSHDVTNVGDDELIVMLWANEIFDREAPDTFPRVL